MAAAGTDMNTRAAGVGSWLVSQITLKRVAIGFSACALLGAAASVIAPAVAGAATTATAATGTAVTTASPAVQLTVAAKSAAGTLLGHAWEGAGIIGDGVMHAGEAAITAAKGVDWSSVGEALTHSPK